MSTQTTSIFGGQSDQVRPANVYKGCTSGIPSTGEFMGYVDSVIIKGEVSKVDVAASNAPTGSQPFNRVVTGSMATIELGLLQPTKERVSGTVQGYQNNGVIQGFGSLLGTDDLSNTTQLVVVPIVNGIETTDATQIWVAPAACASSSFEKKFGQEVSIVKAVYNCYPSSSVTVNSVPVLLVNKSFWG